MSETPQDPAAHERSGPDVASAIGAAENDSALHETHTHPERTKSGEAHVEQSAGDPEMTGAPTEAEPVPRSAAEAQSVRGARVSDQVAGD
ncbi:hypothetical protein [Cryptosporangium aurantiacum]|uniref:Uncharacterized protein n=1 Tax=Cryptosporangium aurantiacum TaxID=134849 RepID=A0A1M7TV23_9ACTN|nr:hypothetical protein [Cryptosporangium aurantiacum]SHN74556.1 hypothetical protein SAMN05443668_107105 [Cryptosporangium aurantiacum]